MTPLPDDLRRRLAAAHQEAMRVHDSPLRADAVAKSVTALTAEVEGAAGLPDELRARLLAALADAQRVLRRDDDGREAARHLQRALSLAEGRPRAPNPFGDD